MDFFQPLVKKGTVSFSAEQKHKKRNNIRIPLYYRKSDSKAVYLGRNSCEFRFLCVFFSRALDAWRTFVRLSRRDHDFCILMRQPLFNFKLLFCQNFFQNFCCAAGGNYSNLGVSET